jgi:hypothetical protein
MESFLSHTKPKDNTGVAELSSQSSQCVRPAGNRLALAS